MVSGFLFKRILGEDSDEDEVDATDDSQFSAIVNSIWSWQRPVVDMR